MNASTWNRIPWRATAGMVMACLLTFPVSAADLPYSRVHVLAAGVSNPGGGWQPLEFAEADAREIADVLRNSYRFEVTLLVGAQATKSAISAELARIRGKMGSRDDFLFVWSGHGAAAVDPSGDKHDRTGFLIPAGTRSGPGASFSDLSRDGIDAKALARSYQTSAGRHRIFLYDSCFSGLAAQAGAPQQLPINLDSDLLEKPSVKVMSAGSDGELVMELRNLGHGVFSGALLEILRADTTKSLVNVFIQLRERMLIEQGRQGGRGSRPQLRVLMGDNADFIFIPPSQVRPFVEGNSGSTLIAGGTARGQYETPVTDAEYTNYVARANSGGQSTVSDQEKQRLEARASMGDPKAMALLTEVLGRSPAPEDQKRAAEYARQGYETQDPFGILALGSAYRNGYGVQRDATEADALFKKSGLGALTSLFNAFTTFGTVTTPTPASNPQNLSVTAGQVGAFATDAASAIAGAFTASPGTRLNRLSGDLERTRRGQPNPDWSGAQREVTRLVENANALPDPSRSSANSELDTLRKAINEKNLPAARESMARLRSIFGQ